MKEPDSIAILIYGNKDSDRDPLKEEKYKDLALTFISKGYDVKSVLYNDEQTTELTDALSAFSALLVWVNPIEEGNDGKSWTRCFLVYRRKDALYLLILR